MFPLIKTLNQYCLKHKLTSMFYVGYQRRKEKNEVNFEADYASDSFMDKNTKSDVHVSPGGHSTVKNMGGLAR